MGRVMPYVYFRGCLQPHHAAHVSLACNSLQYGTTCFGGIRGYVRQGQVKIFRLEDHHERLMTAAKILGFNYHISYEAFHAAIAELVLANKPQSDFYIRPFIFAPDEVLAPKPVGLNFDLAIYFVPLGQYLDTSKGLKLMISSWRKFPDAALPTKAKAGGCYVNSFLATAEVMRCGYDEALLMDHEGYVVEASVANLLMVYRNRLLVPEVGSAQLEGITMRSAIELLQSCGHKVEFARFDRSMLYGCSELMLLGTAMQVAHASEVDGRIIGDGKSGPVCHMLRRQFEALIESEDSSFENWLTPFALELQGGLTCPQPR